MFSSGFLRSYFESLRRNAFNLFAPPINIYIYTRGGCISRRIREGGEKIEIIEFFDEKICSDNWIKFLAPISRDSSRNYVLSIN